MANNYSNEQIIVGAADVFVGAEDGVTNLPGYAEAVPGDPGTPEVLYKFTDGTSARQTLFDDATWRHTGLTQGGVEFAYAPDFGEVDVDQYLDVAKMFKQRQSVTINTTFAQATLDNFLFAWGQPTDTLNDGDPYLPEGDNDLIIHGGALGDKPVERSVVFVGPAPGLADKERVYYLARALNVESSSHSLSKTEATVVPVAMRCLPVGDLAGTVTYGRIIERVVTA